MYKILETVGKTCAGFICVLLIVATKLNIMASTRCSIYTCSKNQLQLSIMKPKSMSAPFLSQHVCTIPAPGTQEALGTWVMWEDALRESSQCLLC